MKPKINDGVQLIDAISSESLNEGAIGVIVEEFSEPEEAYEVRFCDEDVVTVAQIALRPDQSIWFTQSRNGCLKSAERKIASRKIEICRSTTSTAF